MKIKNTLTLDKMIDNLKESLEKNHNLILKPLKIRELIAHAFGYKNANTMIGLNNNVIIKEVDVIIDGKSEKVLMTGVDSAIQKLMADYERYNIDISMEDELLVREYYIGDLAWSVEENKMIRIVDKDVKGSDIFYSIEHLGKPLSDTDYLGLRPIIESDYTLKPSSNGVSAYFKVDGGDELEINIVNYLETTDHETAMLLLLNPKCSSESDDVFYFYENLNIMKVLKKQIQLSALISKNNNEDLFGFSVEVNEKELEKWIKDHY